MSGKKKDEGLSRRDFMKTIGIAGIASTGLNMGKAEGAPEQADAGKLALPKRKLGKTGAEVSVLALGGGFDTINNQLLLRQSLNWGINFWDTAENYGNGQSEEGYGHFLARNTDGRKDLFLATKLHAGEPEAMTAALDKCLKRLSTDHVDLLHVHGIGDFSEIAEPKPVRQWVSGAKRAGKIKFFGFATHANMEKCLLDASKADWIDVIMFAYSFRLMNSPDMKEAIAACAHKGIGLVAMKTQGGRQVMIESEAELKMTERFLERGFTDKQAKIKVVFENPNIASVCSLMPSLTILSANVAAARDQTSLTRSDFELLEKFAAETHQSYCAGCGRICYEAVGGAAPVSDVMRCLMYYRDYGERELAREVFSGLPGQARAQLTRIDYARAEQACPRKLPISKLMREASEILQKNSRQSSVVG
ncbi:putative oxidoreductase of aldo/keto reductase family [Syntrophobacter sp. SbD1]|nr:putative oxidoreductase of aldo/keto reductase family [Syntrophobacter sp. SbD1]